MFLYFRGKQNILKGTGISENVDDVDHLAGPSGAQTKPKHHSLCLVSDLKFLVRIA